MFPYNGRTNRKERNEMIHILVGQAAIDLPSFKGSGNTPDPGGSAL